MGNFLSSPKTEKETVVGSGNGLQTGTSSMQGWRTHMEDAHVVEQELSFCSSTAFFSVFDGHGGSLAAEFAAENIVEYIRNSPEVSSVNEKIESLSPDSIGKAIAHAYFKIDENLRQHPAVARGEDNSGCTAISAALTSSHVIVANTGDSRSVLAKNGTCVPMSFDHKPFNDIEKSRIENAGGMVRMKRVNGDLAVSRALGDFVYKNRPDLTAEEQQVTALPDVIVEPRSGEEEFLIIACDGIWDVMSNEECCDFVRGLMNQGEKDMGLIAEELLDHCLQLGSRDNMTATVVCFSAAKFGSGEGVAGLRREREALREKAEKEGRNQNQES